LQSVDQVHVRLGIGVGLRFADRRLTEHIEREARSTVAQRFEGRQRLGGVPADDEALRERLQLATDHGRGDRRQWRVRAGQADAEAEQPRGVQSRLPEVLAQVARHLTARPERGEDVDEAEELDLEALVGHRPVHHLVLPAGAGERRRFGTLDQAEDPPGGCLDVALERGGGAAFALELLACHRRP